MRPFIGVLALCLVISFLTSYAGGAIGSTAQPVRVTSLGPMAIAASVHPFLTGLHSPAWGGYGVNGSNGAVSDVRANWHVPQIAKACPAKTTTASSFFVAMDGWTSTTMVAAGTSTTCSSGSPLYSGWVIVGSFYASVSFTITPADSMFGEVKYNPTTKTTTAILKDLTTGHSYTKSLKGSSNRATAEWVADDPYQGFTYTYPLTDFGWVTFRNASATISGHTHSISGFSYTPLIMWSTLHSKVKATTGTLSSHGYRFVVTWKFQGP
jgi:hypothetical protein